MIELTKGDILKSNTEAVVNTVNCVGVMGRGIALQFKKSFPENFRKYEEACNRKEVQVGKMFIYDSGSMINPRYIINFPTKKHWKGKSDIDYINSGLADLVEQVNKLNIKSISIPPLGCGLGGLKWHDVLPKIQDAFRKLDNQVEVKIFEPNWSPSINETPKTKVLPNMTVGRASLIGLMRRYLGGLMDPSITLLELQKLMYFMQESGEPLKLKFQKAAYGPYAPNLSHVLNVMEGHFIKGYLDGGDDPRKPIELKPESTLIAEKFLENYEETNRRFEKVTSLIKGFETPYGMELLSTVHWIANSKKSFAIDDIVHDVHQWNDRKKMFSKENIEVAFNTLVRDGWIKLAS